MGLNFNALVHDVKMLVVYISIELINYFFERKLFNFSIKGNRVLINNLLICG